MNAFVLVQASNPICFAVYVVIYPPTIFALFGRRMQVGFCECLFVCVYICVCVPLCVALALES